MSQMHVDYADPKHSPLSKPSVQVQQSDDRLIPYTDLLRQAITQTSAVTRAWVDKARATGAIAESDEKKAMHLLGVLYRHPEMLTWTYDAEEQYGCLEAYEVIMDHVESDCPECEVIRYGESLLVILVTDVLLLCAATSFMDDSNNVKTSLIFAAESLAHEATVPPPSYEAILSKHAEQAHALATHWSDWVGDGDRLRALEVGSTDPLSMIYVHMLVCENCSANTPGWMVIAALDKFEKGVAKALLHAALPDTENKEGDGPA